MVSGLHTANRSFGAILSLQKSHLSGNGRLIGLYLVTL